MDEPFLTRTEVASRLGLTLPGLDCMLYRVRRGDKSVRIPLPFYIGPKSPRWRKSDIDALVANREEVA